MLDGACQFSVTWLVPGVAVRFCGALGVTLPTGSAVTATVEVAEFAGDALSVTVKVAVYVPTVEYVWLGFCAVLTAEPSPKFQL